MTDEPRFRLVVATYDDLTHHQIYASYADADTAWHTLVNAYSMLGKPCGGAVIQRADLPTWWKAYTMDGEMWRDLLRPGWTQPWRKGDVAPPPIAGGFIDGFMTITDGEIDTLAGYIIQHRDDLRSFYRLKRRHSAQTKRLIAMGEGWADHWLTFVADQRACRLAVSA